MCFRLLGKHVRACLCAQEAEFMEDLWLTRIKTLLVIDDKRNGCCFSLFLFIVHREL